MGLDMVGGLILAGSAKNNKNGKYFFCALVLDKKEISAKKALCDRATPEMCHK
jgi:hypothetical protein